LGTWNPNINLSNTNGTAAWDTTGKKSYELVNHLGNVMATITDKRLQHSSDGSLIDYFDADVQNAQEYYSFGSIIPGRTYSAGGKNYRYGFNGKENDNEVKKDSYGNNLIGGQQDYGMRIYDGRLNRFLSVDPLAHMREWVSPYNFVQNNPINRTDPTGALDGEYDVDGTTGKRTKVSDLGGNEVDYNHYKGGANDGKTEIVNKSTGDKMLMNSSSFVKGYTHRSSQTNFENIYNEFLTGTGPENSLISGRGNHMVQDIMKSPQFAKAAKGFMENGTDNKFFFAGEFGPSGAVDAGKNMTAQMIGKANFSFYPVGNQLVIMAVDSKSKSSWSLNPVVKAVSMFSNYFDTPREQGKVIPESTTNQTYIWNLPIKK